MKKIKRVCILLLVFLCIAAVAIYSLRKQIRVHFTPSVEQVGEISLSFRNDTCNLSSMVAAINNTSLHIRIDTIKYTLCFFGKNYLESKAFIGIDLPQNSADSILFSLKIPYTEMMKDIKSGRGKMDSATYALIILVKYSTFMGTQEILISKSEKLKIPRAPELEVIEINYSKIRLRSILAKAKILITNHGPVKLHITNMIYSMSFGKQGEIIGNYPTAIDIIPNGTTSVDLPLKITPKKISRTLFDVLLNKDVYNYTLHVNAILGSPDQPGHTFQIDLVKKGKMELKK